MRRLKNFVELNWPPNAMGNASQKIRRNHKLHSRAFLWLNETTIYDGV